MHEFRLLLGREPDHSMCRVGIAHGGEDLAVQAEVGMMVVLVFLGSGEKHHQAAELFGGHSVVG